jgi:NifU-like protein
MIERTIRSNGLTNLEDITHYTKAGGGCNTCVETLEEILAATNAAMVEEGVLDAAKAFVAGAQPRPDLKAKAKADAAAAKTSGPVQLQEPASLREPAAAAPASKLSTLQRIRLIEQAIEELRPYLKQDGGDCELVDIDGNKVMVKLTGACVGCQAASVTLQGVQAKLMEKVGEPLRVIPVAHAH